MNAHLTRRGFVASVAVSSLAGCLGYQIEETADVDRRKQRIAELEDRAEQLDANIASLESELDQSEQTVAEQQQRLDDLRVEHVMTVYELADDDAAYAKNNWSHGWDNIDVGDYETATLDFERAYGLYLAAVRGFKRARDLSREYDLGVADVINDTRLYEHHLSESAYDMINACIFYADGDQTSGASYHDRAEEHYDDAQAYEYTVPDDLGSLLTEVEGVSA